MVRQEVETGDFLETLRSISWRTHAHTHSSESMSRQAARQAHVHVIDTIVLRCLGQDFHFFSDAGILGAMLEVGPTQFP